MHIVQVLVQVQVLPQTTTATAGVSKIKSSSRLCAEAACSTRLYI